MPRTPSARTPTRLRRTVWRRRDDLRRMDRRLDIVVFIAALMSIPVAFEGRLTGWLLVVDVIAWAIFVFEAAVKIGAHGRRAYFTNRANWIDLAIIVLSAPYHLAAAVPLVARIGSLSRLVRLVRIGLVVLKLLRRGRSMLVRRNVPFAAGLVALSTMMAAGAVFLSEQSVADTAFRTYGDALWWAVVTLTTVGYGDLSPATPVGRVAAVFLMLVGVAFLGTVAAAFASLFIDEDLADEEALVREELRGLRDDVRRLQATVDGLVRSPQPPDGS